MYDCITIGDTKLDTFVVLHDASIECQLKLPECQLCIGYGKKIPVQAIDSQIAGSAPNVAVALSRMHLKSALVTMMGDDGTHRLALERMHEEKVDTRFIKTVAGRRSSFSVVLNFRGERTILAAHEPYAYALPKTFSAKWLYVCEQGTGYEKLYREIIARVSADHVHLAMNPGEVQIEERKPVLYEIMKRTTLLFMNVGEARALTKVSASAKLASVVTSAWKLNGKTVVVTDGKNGAYGFDGTKILFSPIFPGKRVDATGAGDSFAAAVLSAMMRDLPLTEALRWGAVNSASVVGKVGPQVGLLSDTEIKKRLRAHPSFKIKSL